MRKLRKENYRMTNENKNVEAKKLPAPELLVKMIASGKSVPSQSTSR